MKKKIIFPICIIVIVIIVVLVYYFTPKVFGKNIDASEVDHIEVFDGNTGIGFTIDDPEDVQDIIENIQSQTMKRGGLSIGHMGYTFRISYMDENDQNVISDFILNSENTIRKDPFFYCCDGGLCFDELETLEEKYAAE